MGFIYEEPRGASCVRKRLLRLLAVCVLSLCAGGDAFANGFVAPYGPANFTLINSGGVTPNGFATFPDSNTLVLTGSNDGNGALGGTTDLVIAALGNGIFQFDWSFTTMDATGFENGGYLLGANFVQLSDCGQPDCPNGESGVVSVPVVAGETIGFRVGTVDNTGGPGVLTITDFNAPVATPEPGTASLLCFAVAGVLLAHRRFRFRWRVLGAAAIAAVGLTAPASAQQAFYAGTNVTNSLALVGTVNLQQQAAGVQTAARAARPLVEMAAQPALTAQQEVLVPPPPFLRPPVASSTSPTHSHERAAVHGPVSAAVPAVQSLAVMQGGTGFNALSHLDERNADGGNQFSIEPPSPSIAVGNGYVLEGVNDAVQVFSTAGKPLLPAVLSSNQVFGLSQPAINRTTNVHGVYLTDMRVFYDPGINRWMVLQRSQDNDAAGNNLASSHLYLAVSLTGDPTAWYNIYLMDTTNTGHSGCPCIADYPQIGADQFGLHIAWNEFNYNPIFNSYQFIDAAILAVSKAALATGSQTPTAFQFLIPYTTGYEFAIQPATTPPGASSFIGAGGLEYFASTISSLSTGSQIALWAMYNTSSLATPAPFLTLTRTFVSTLPYVFPDVARQKAGKTPYGSSLGQPLEFLDGGDQRVQALSYAGGRLFLTIPTGLNDATGHLVIGGAYVVLSPTFRGSVLAAQVVNQGYLMVNQNYLLRPAIAVNAQGNGAIAVTLVGPDWYPSAAFIPFQALGTPATIQVAAAGALPEDGFTGYPPTGDGVARWGDYNTAVVNSDGTVWMVVEYIGNYLRTQFANWNTYIIN